MEDVLREEQKVLQYVKEMRFLPEARERFCGHM